MADDDDAPKTPPTQDENDTPNALTGEHVLDIRRALADTPDAVEPTTPTTTSPMPPNSEGGLLARLEEALDNLRALKAAKPPKVEPTEEQQSEGSEGLLLRELPGGGVEFKPWA